MTTEEGDLMDEPEQISPSGGRPAAGIRGGLATVDVVICAYTAAREVLLRRAIASVVGQQHAARVIVVIDHSPELLRALSGRPALGDAVEIHENIYEPGLSGARNTGLGLATADIVAFLDDDACADDAWLESIRHAHADPDVIGMGGWVTPEWEGGAPPRWFPAEFLWIVGCSYRGLPAGPMAEIRNPIGANMSFVRARLAAVGGFRTGLGRIGTTPLGCEETEVAIRVRASGPGGKIVHVDSARVDHFVPRSRATWSYFCDRCVAEGRSKAVVVDAVGGGDGLSSERRYVLRVLPSGVQRGIGEASRGDALGLLRSGAIVAGLSLTTWGYLSARHGAGAKANDGPLQTVRTVRDRLRVRRLIPLLLVAWVGMGVPLRRRRVTARRRKIGVPR